MSIFTFRDFTLRMAGEQVGPPGVLARYNHNAKCFNIATCALITTVALALIAHSTLLLAMAGLAYWARQGFSREILLTTANLPGNHEVLELDRVFSLEMNAAFRRLMAIQDAAWQPIAYQFGNFVAWMNTTPVQAR